MNKSFTLAAALSVLCVTGSAFALDTGAPLGEMKILGTSIRLSSDGGLLMPLGAIKADCGYMMEWKNPLNEEDLLVCNLLETKPFGKTCSGASMKDIDTMVQTAPGCACIGFNAAGAQVPTVLNLLEVSCGASVRLQGVAIQGGVVYPVAVQHKQRYYRVRPV